MVATTPTEEAGVPRSSSIPVTPEPRTRALIVVFLLFSVLAFGEDLLAATNDIVGWRLSSSEFGMATLALDLVVLGFLARAGRNTRLEETQAAGDTAGGASRWWLYWGGACILGLDVIRLLVLKGVSLLPDLALLLGYLPGLGALLIFVLDLDFNRARRSREDADTSARVDDLFAALPLLAGTGAAYIGQRLYADQLTTINTEYFSQITQVIPLLLVALGVERRWFESTGPVRSIRWAVTVYTVLILVIGEALAISALPNDPKAEGDLYQWHEYLAFAISLYACFVALAAVVVALLRNPPTVQRRS
jgi:hypothetical protein